jgi:hypothetical protein
METNLDKYNDEETKLIEDIQNNDLSYNDVKERCYKLWDLIPIDYNINPIKLNDLLKEKYGNELEFNKHDRIFKIDIGKLNANEIEDFIKKFANKVKNVKIII